MADRADVATMYAKKSELELAHGELRAEFCSRPRRSNMSHVYSQAHNRSHYGLVLVRDYEIFGDDPRNAIKELDKNLKAVRKAIARLKADPYVCTQPWRIREWEAYRG